MKGRQHIYEGNIPSGKQDIGCFRFASVSGPRLQIYRDSTDDGWEDYDIASHHPILPNEVVYVRQTPAERKEYDFPVSTHFDILNDAGPNLFIEGWKISHYAPVGSVRLKPGQFQSFQLMHLVCAEKISLDFIRIMFERFRPTPLIPRVDIDED